MKIRTEEELQRKLDEDFAWRRKELTVIKSRIATAKAHSINTELRVGIVMLYSHWEGFVKNISQYYVTFISQKRLDYSALKDNFIGIELAQIIDKNKNTINANKYTIAVDFIRNKLTNRSNIKCEIDTKSNLNSTVFQEILQQLGIDYTKYATKEKLIDERLLWNRNTIAHGNYLKIDKETFETLYDNIIEIMVDLKNTILNNAVTKEYAV